MSIKRLVSRISTIALTAAAMTSITVPAQADECRWKIKFVSHTLNSSDERREEVKACVSAEGESVCDGYRRMREGETRSVGEEVVRVDIEETTTFRYELMVHHKDRGSVLLPNRENGSTKLNCVRGSSEGKNRTKSHRVGTSTVRVAFERIGS